METIELFPHVTVAGNTLTVNVDDFAESWDEIGSDLDEEEIVELLTNKLLDYPGAIDSFTINNFTHRARFCIDIYVAVFAVMAGRATRPTSIRLGVTDTSFESFKDLETVVNLHRYITDWTLALEIDEIPRLSDQILKPFHTAQHVKRLTVVSTNTETRINQDARDNFGFSVVDLVNANPKLIFTHLFTSKETTN